MSNASKRSVYRAIPAVEVRTMNTAPFWRKCSSCKKAIAYEGRFFRCSVSTCNAKRTSYVFCSMPCWSAHVPTMGHRNPWAEDDRAPSQEEARRQEEASAPSRERRERNSSGAHITTAASAGAERTVRRRLSQHLPSSATENDSTLSTGQHVPHDVLVVVSKLKAYIRARSECNTSASVNEALSDIIREQCDLAMKRALADGRSTVMDRDFKA